MEHLSLEQQSGTEASRYLVALAVRIAEVYVTKTSPCAILLTGSAAEGTSDYFSDLDIIAYYNRLPSEDKLSAARASAQAFDARTSTGREGEMLVEEYVLHGVECQVAHCTIVSWERNLASVLEKFDPTTRAQKSIMGLKDGLALHGHELIGRWQERVEAYPEGLAKAMVEHHLQFSPLWLAAERWDPRDATIFYHQMLADTSLNLLGVLAGLNHVYYSTFQFKRLHQFVSTMNLVPEHLADRIDTLFKLDPGEAGDALDRLVDETVTLVEANMPKVNTTLARRYIGVRHNPWSPT